MTGATSIHDNQGETVIRPPVFEADHPDVTGLPERVQAVVLDAFRTAPQAGQLWRITWADLPPRLGLVLDVGDSYTVMAPVTLDADRRVDAAMLIHDTPLGATAVAWPQVRTGMGDFALAECYGSVDADTLQAARARARVRTGNDDLDAWNAGLDDAEVLARRAYRDRLAAEFTALCDSDWNHADLHDEPEVFIDADLARKAGLTMRALAEIADLPDAAAYTVWRGEHPLHPTRRQPSSLPSVRRSRRLSGSPRPIPVPEPPLTPPRSGKGSPPSPRTSKSPRPTSAATCTATSWPHRAGRLVSARSVTTGSDSRCFSTAA